MSVLCSVLEINGGPIMGRRRAASFLWRNTAAFPTPRPCLDYVRFQGLITLLINGAAAGVVLVAQYGGGGGAPRHGRSEDGHESCQGLVGRGFSVKIRDVIFLAVRRT